MDLEAATRRTVCLWLLLILSWNYLESLLPSYYAIREAVTSKRIHNQLGVLWDYQSQFDFGSRHVKHTHTHTQNDVTGKDAFPVSKKGPHGYDYQWDTSKGKDCLDKKRSKISKQVMYPRVILKVFPFSLLCWDIICPKQ